MSVLLCLVMDVLWLTREWFGKAEASAHLLTRLISFHIGSCQLHGRSSPYAFLYYEKALRRFLRPNAATGGVVGVTAAQL